MEPPSCPGLRCPTGLCIPAEKICNGERDCPSGYDELPEQCDHKRSNYSQMEFGTIKISLKCQLIIIPNTYKLLFNLALILSLMSMNL